MTRAFLDEEARALIGRRLERARADEGVYAKHYVEDVTELLSTLKLAEETRDAAQRGGTSVVLFRRRVVGMLRALNYHGIADDIEKERVTDAEP